MDVEIPNGFIHLKDLIEIQRSDPIFSTPKNVKDDVEEQMDEQIENNEGVAFDLRLGSQYYLSGELRTKRIEDEGGILHIQPGQFALLTTYEIFHMPINLVAFISMRFGIKAEGLINVSGFQVDPGYQGVFIFSVYNAGPGVVTLEYKSKIFTIIFAKTTQPVKEKRKPINEIPKEKWVKLMQNKNVSLLALDERVKELEKWREYVRYLIPVSIGIVSAIAVIFEILYHHGGSG